MNEQEALRYLHRNYVGWLSLGQWEPERSLPPGTYPPSGEWMRIEWRFSTPLDAEHWNETEQLVANCLQTVGETWALCDAGKVSAVVMANCLSGLAQRAKLWVRITDAAEELQQFTGEPVASFCGQVCTAYRELANDHFAELNVWWTQQCVLTPQERRAHRRKIQNYLKKAQYGHISGYVVRCMQRDESNNSNFWFWIPLVMESLWMHQRPPMATLMEHLDFQELEKEGADALALWIRKTCATLRSTVETEDPIARVMDSIYRDCSLPYSQSNLAEGLGLTPAYFSRLFEKRTGVRFSDFLTQARIARAQELLRNGGKLDDVAAASGFQRKSYFCEVFRRQTGMTAMHYRIHWKEMDTR